MSDTIYYSLNGVLSRRASSDPSSIVIPEGAHVISENEYVSATETARAQRQAADMVRATELRLNSIESAEDTVGATIDMSGKGSAIEPIVEKSTASPKKRKKSA